LVFKMDATRKKVAGIAAQFGGVRIGHGWWYLFGVN